MTATRPSTKPAAGKATPAPPGVTMHEALVEIGIELLAVAVLVFLASTPRGAKIATTTLASLWFVSLILHYNGSHL